MTDYSDPTKPLENCLSYTTEGTTFSVELDRRTGFGSWSYWYEIRFCGELLYRASDLESGVRDEPEPLAEMLSTLLNFFGAFAESLDYGENGENANLFPENCRELAKAFGSDRLAMMALEIVGEDQ